MSADRGGSGQGPAASEGGQGPAASEGGKGPAGSGGEAAGGGERVALRLRLRGRVQGVGFRYFTRSVARELGVAGRVRNLPDGRVEIEVAGAPESVERFKSWMRQGPPGAAVTGMDEEPLPAAPPWDRFEIDR